MNGCRPLKGRLANDGVFSAASLLTDQQEKNSGNYRQSNQNSALSSAENRRRRPVPEIRRRRIANDVIGAVRLARDNGLLAAVRGGGHNIAGNAVCDGGLLIDLSPMRSVHIDSKERIARVEPGVTLGEFDREAQSFGLATPLGINSTTGVAGLTLGGGFGWLGSASSWDFVEGGRDWVTASRRWIARTPRDR